MIKALKRRRRRTEAANRLYEAVSRRAREPAFYQEFGVADSIDGRFDLIVLHAWVLLEHLRETGETELAQSLVDILFARFEDALREQGAGDMGIGRRMKKLASAFYGRLRAYSESDGETDLADAILRNVYRGEASRVDHATLLAKYVGELRRQTNGGDPACNDVWRASVPRRDVQA